MENIESLITFLAIRLASIDSEVIALLLIIVAGAAVHKAFLSSARAASHSIGINPESSTVSIDGSRTVAVRHYVSEMQGLAGKPDALISENGFIIPVERKPLARKLRDRYVAQILVYMRLIEEFEGKKPPYGYLILGPNCRKVKIENSEARQSWLQGHLDQMRSILSGAEPFAQPHPRKCDKCDVSMHCKFVHSQAANAANSN